MSTPNHNDYDLDQYDHGDPCDYQQSEDDSAEDAFEASTENSEHDDNSDDTYYMMGEY